MQKYLSQLGLEAPQATLPHDVLKAEGIQLSLGQQVLPSEQGNDDMVWQLVDILAIILSINRQQSIARQSTGATRVWSDVKLGGQLCCFSSALEHVIEEILALLGPGFPLLHVLQSANELLMCLVNSWRLHACRIEDSGSTTDMHCSQTVLTWFGFKKAPITPDEVQQHTGKHSF